MFIALEGIDGIGKSTVFEYLRTRNTELNNNFIFHEKKDVLEDHYFPTQTMQHLRSIVWPDDEGVGHEQVGDEYWLLIVAAWFSLVSNSLKRIYDDSQAILYEHWYYRFVAKYQYKQYDIDKLAKYFDTSIVPDSVILLDGDPNNLFDRRVYLPPEMGGQDDFGGLGRETYVTYQSEIRKILLEFAREKDWIVIEKCDQLSADQVAKLVVKKISEITNREL